MSISVAHVNLAKGYRGGERQTELLILGLSPMVGRQVLVARRGAALAKRMVDADVELREVSGGLVAAARATRGVDLVHVHEGRGVYAAWLRSLVSGTPYIVTRRVNNPVGKHVLARAAYRRATCVAAVAQDIADILTRYDPRLRTAVVHSSSSSLPVDAAQVEAIRKAHDGKWLVGNVGALDNRQKGQQYIIEVARELEAPFPRIHFLLVGGGADEAMLKERAEGLSNLSFCGFVDNVGDYLAAFDLFILPSNKEGIGGILLDAMEQGLPVIASRVGGLPEIVRDGDNGVLIDPASPQQLKAAILQMYESPQTAQAMGQRGRSFAEDFTADVMCRRYLALYREALERHASPDSH